MIGDYYKAGIFKLFFV